MNYTMVLYLSTIWQEHPQLENRGCDWYGWAFGFSKKLYRLLDKYLRCSSTMTRLKNGSEPNESMYGVQWSLELWAKSSFGLQAYYSVKMLYLFWDMVEGNFCT